MRLCLIRHGETVFNIDDRMQGVRDIELSPRGRGEAVALGKKLRGDGFFPDRLCTSPVKRARDTADLLGFDVPLEVLKGFSARSLGALEGLTKNEIRERFPGALENLLEWDWAPPGGTEALGDLFRRATAEIAGLEGRNPGDGLIIVVTHSGVLEALVRGWLKLRPVDSLPFPLKNSGAIFCEKQGPVYFPGKIVAVGEGENVDHS